MRDVAERFWAKVEKTDTCWIWRGCRRSKDPRRAYGQFYFDGRTQTASRVAYMMHVGPIPDGLLVCHHCDNPPCVRPDHLFVGTMSDNLLDAARKGRTYAPSLRGDEHPSRRYPEILKRGDQHWTRVHPEWVIRGMAKTSAKITDADVPEIKRLAASGASQRKIARIFNISQRNVGRIVRGERWRHVAALAEGSA